jgi:hypothetical protein
MNLLFPIKGFSSVFTLPFVLLPHSRSLISAFTKVLDFLLKQAHRPWIKCYLKRDEILGMIDECGQELTEALEMFSVSFPFTSGGYMRVDCLFPGCMRGFGDVSPLTHSTRPLQKNMLTI